MVCTSDKNNRPYASASADRTLDTAQLRREEFISAQIQQLLRIVENYNSPYYAAQNYRESNSFHAGIFIRELLKNGVNESELETLARSAEHELNPTALQFLYEAIRHGIDEYQSTKST